MRKMAGQSILHIVCVCINRIGTDCSSNATPIPSKCVKGISAFLIADQRDVGIEALPGARDPDAYLFPRCAEGRGQYSLADCWHAVCDDAGLGRLGLHDLRHTAASQVVTAGENLPLVVKLLGHRRHRTTAGYAHLGDEHLVEAAEKVGSIIAKAMTVCRV